MTLLLAVFKLVGLLAVGAIFVSALVGVVCAVCESRDWLRARRAERRAAEVEDLPASEAADLAASKAFFNELRLLAENDELRVALAAVKATCDRLIEHNCELARDLDLMAERLAPFLDAEALAADFERSSVQAVALVSALDRVENVVPLQRKAAE